MARNRSDYQHKKNPTVPKIAQLNVKGRIFDNPKVISEKFNDFFVNIGPNKGMEIQKVTNIFTYKFLINQRNQFIILIARISSTGYSK